MTGEPTPPNLECVVVEPTTAHTGTVIWLHGLGASGHDFEDMPPLLGLDHIRYVFPHAPTMQVTINYGTRMPAWYDIVDLDWNNEEREDEASIRSSAELVVRLLEDEHARGIAYERMVLAGFSQGGALALHVGTRFPEALAGIMALSAYQLLPNAHAAEADPSNATTPMLFCHGRLDPMVPIDRGRSAHEAMAEAGHPTEWAEYMMEHQVIMPQVERIGTWLASRLPGE